MLDQAEQLDRFISRMQAGDRSEIDTVLPAELRDVGELVISLRGKRPIEWPDDDYPSRAVARLAQDSSSEARD